MGRAYAHHLWHGRQHLCPLHGVQCSHEVVQRHCSQDCISSFNDFDMEASLSQTAALLGEVTSSENIHIGVPEPEEIYMSKLEEGLRASARDKETAAEDSKRRSSG